jgi:SAM-dependent methyltransferase
MRAPALSIDAFEHISCPLCDGAAAHTILRARDRLSPADPTLHTIVRCDICGLAYTRPRPAPSSIYNIYPPGYSGDRRRSLIDSIESAYRTLQQREAVRWLAALRPQRGPLLDVGCGRGDLLLALQRDGWRTTGLEPSPEGAATARARGLHVNSGRFEDLVEGSARYEAIVFSGALEHLHEPLASLRRARDLLESGGLIAVLYLPLLDSPQARVFGRRWLALDLPRHLTHFESTTYPRFPAQAGLPIVAERDYTRRHNASQLVCSLLPSLQKHRLYQAETSATGGRPGTLLAPAARRAAYAVALTAATPVSRLETVLNLTPMRSYFLERQSHFTHRRRSRRR